MSRPERWGGTSRVVTVLDAARETARRWIDGAGTLGAAETAGSRLAAVARRSWLYRWITAEPEPEVVVIDLRETYTVGPVLSLLDRCLGVLGPPAREWGRRLRPLWEESWIREMGASVAGPIETSRTGRMVAATLEPPDVERRQNEEQ